MMLFLAAFTRTCLEATQAQQASESKQAGLLSLGGRCNQLRWLFGVMALISLWRLAKWAQGTGHTYRCNARPKLWCQPTKAASGAPLGLPC